MNFFTSIIGIALIVFGIDGYFNNGQYTSMVITPNYDIAMTMIVMGSLVLLCGICLCEFRKLPGGRKPDSKPATKNAPKNALTH